MKILITGGTGSLGQQLITDLDSNIHIIVYSRDEAKHAVIKKNNVTSVIGDVRDFQRLDATVKKYKPDNIIHAAALKRVDDMELAPEECVKTNIIGTQNIVVSALEHEVPRTILVSTDKACQPINVYGSSKFLAEKIFINMDYGLTHIKFSVVRYGNVIASRGSFIPLWKSQILDDIKINITDVNCTRFLFSLKEASTLVLNCLHDMIGGEVFIPKLTSYRVFDVYTELCKKLGKNISTHYILTGIRPGEKIHEDMLSIHELTRTKQTPNENTLAVLPECVKRKYNYIDYKGSYLNSATSLGNIREILKYL